MYDFMLTAEERELKKEVRRFVREEVASCPGDRSSALGILLNDVVTSTPKDVTVVLEGEDIKINGMGLPKPDVEYFLTI